MSDAKTDSLQKQVFHTTRNGIAALGVYDGEKFEVLEGSQVSSVLYPSVPQSIKQQWFTALKNGDIVYQDNKHYLSKSMSFSSPSAAACFVLGASANGWTEWKDKSGRTLDELFRRQAEKA